ncbi:MAG: DUF4837 family protein [Bacteroidales bacterium]
MRTPALFLILAMTVMASCGDSSLTRTLPNITGTTGEVLVVMDKALWNGSPGAAVREQVAPFLVGLPQPEPAFRILPVNPEGFRDIYIAHRNVLIVKTGIDYSDTLVNYARNRWAETQLVITVTGPDSAAVADCHHG